MVYLDGKGVDFLNTCYNDWRSCFKQVTVEDIQKQDYEKSLLGVLEIRRTAAIAQLTPLKRKVEELENEVEFIDNTIKEWKSTHQ